MKSTVNKTHIARIKQQRRIVGMLQFSYKDDQNFSKWYSLTENLVIKAFGQKSNQLSQLHDIAGDMLASDDGEYLIDRRLEVKDAKEKLKDLLSVFAEELELDFEEDARSVRRGGSSVRMTNIQTVTQTVDVATVIKQVIETIQQSEPDQVKVKEAVEKLSQLESELKKKSPAWSTVKSVLEWLLNFSRDAFLSVLPVLLEKYR